VHYASAITIYQRNAGGIGYSRHPVCGTVPVTLTVIVASDRRAQVTCKRCLQWFTGKHNTRGAGLPS